MKFIRVSCTTNPSMILFRNVDEMMSLSSGLVGADGVNCHMARTIGKKATFKSRWRKLKMSNLNVRTKW